MSRFSKMKVIEKVIIHNSMPVPPKHIMMKGDLSMFIDFSDKKRRRKKKDENEEEKEEKNVNRNISKDLDAILKGELPDNNSIKYQSVNLKPRKHFPYLKLSINKKNSPKKKLQKIIFYDSTSTPKSCRKGLYSSRKRKDSVLENTYSMLMKNNRSKSVVQKRKNSDILENLLRQYDSHEPTFDISITEADPISLTSRQRSIRGALPSIRTERGRRNRSQI